MSFSASQMPGSVGSRPTPATYCDHGRVAQLAEAGHDQTKTIALRSSIESTAISNPDSYNLRNAGATPAAPSCGAYSMGRSLIARRAGFSLKIGLNGERWPVQFGSAFCLDSKIAYRSPSQETRRGALLKQLQHRDGGVRASVDLREWRWPSGLTNILPLEVGWGIRPAAMFLHPLDRWLVVNGPRQAAGLLSVHKSVTPSAVFHSHRDGTVDSDMVSTSQGSRPRSRDLGNTWATRKPKWERVQLPHVTMLFHLSPVAPRGAVNHGRGIAASLFRTHLSLLPWAEGGCSARDLGTLFFRNPICDTGLRNANFKPIYQELVQLPAGLAERPRRGYVRSRGVVGNTTTPRCWLTRYRVGRRREAKPVSIRPPAAWAVVAGSSPVGVARFHGRGGTRDRPLKSQPFPLCWGTNGRLALFAN